MIDAYRCLEDVDCDVGFDEFEDGIAKKFGAWIVFW